MCNGTEHADLSQSPALRGTLWPAALSTMKSTQFWLQGDKKKKGMVLDLVMQWVCAANNFRRWDCEQLMKQAQWGREEQTMVYVLLGYGSC